MAIAGGSTSRRNGKRGRRKRGKRASPADGKGRTKSVPKRRGRGGYLEGGAYRRARIDRGEPTSEELLRRYREQGDRAARDVLIERHLPDVAALAHGLHAKLPPSVDVEDLCNAGYGGLLRCIETWDPAKGRSFSTYLRRRVHGAMLDELRAMDWLPRLLRARLARRDRVVQELRQELGRKPVDGEVAERLGISLDAYRRSLAPGQLQSLGFGGGDGEDGDGRVLGYAGGALRDADPGHPWANLYQQELIERIRSLLSDTEWTLVELHYFEGLKLREVARRLGLSPARICQIHGRLLARLKDRLAGEAAV